MKFAVIADYDPNDPKLAEIRPVHRKYLTGLLEKGNLAISGPFTENGGALIVLEAGSKDEAEALMKADPFVQTGVFTSYAIHPWNPIFINRSLLPE
jgi:uncharacterized protein YciI